MRRQYRFRLVRLHAADLDDARGRHVRERLRHDPFRLHGRAGVAHPARVQRRRRLRAPVADLLPGRHRADVLLHGGRAGRWRQPHLPRGRLRFPADRRADDGGSGGDPFRGRRARRLVAGYETKPTLDAFPAAPGRVQAAGEPSTYRGGTPAASKAKRSSTRRCDGEGSPTSSSTTLSAGAGQRLPQA